MFGAKNRNIGIPQFCFINVGFKGVYIIRTCFCDTEVDQVSKIKISRFRHLFSRLLDLLCYLFDLDN